MNEDPQALFAMGAAALERGELEAAERIFGRIVSEHPDAHPAWNALALVAVRGGHPEAAVERSRRALQRERRNPVYLNNLGIALGELGQLAEAEKTLRQALRIRPAYAEGMFNLGKVLHKQLRLAESLRAYERAYAMDPGFAGLRISLAHMYLVLGQAERALVIAREITGPDAGKMTAVLVSSCIAELQGMGAAVAFIENAVAAHPDLPVLRAHLGLTLLGLGRWREGWQGYVWRPGIPPGERWTGTPALPRALAGKEVLLRGEQGIGDILFFLRFAADLRARGARATLSCAPRLARLLSGSGAVDELVDESKFPEDRAFDYTLWIGDLPAALEADGCPPALGLRCDTAALERVRSVLTAFGPPPYLGLTWRAGSDVLRSREFGNLQNSLSKEVPLQRLGTAVRAWKGTIVSLQRNPHAGELEAVARPVGAAVHDLASFSDDLTELAALLSLLDEYVAVSSTNMHMLAGLGRVARVLVPYPAEWRWMHSGGESPWFPGFRLYRQPSFADDWSEPLARLRAELFA